MTDERRATGRGGEEVAAAYLERKGWQILARNWRCRTGEIDIVARDPGGATVVCEVKCRLGDGFGAPLEAVTVDKVRRLWRLALEWAATQPGARGSLRVDAVGVRTYPDGTSAITHVEGIAL